MLVREVDGFSPGLVAHNTALNFVYSRTKPCKLVAAISIGKNALIGFYQQQRSAHDGLSGMVVAHDPLDEAVAGGTLSKPLSCQHSL